MADVASTLRAWSVTPGSNLPNTGTVVGAGLAPNLQTMQAVVRQYLASIGTSVIASGTTDLSLVDGFTIPISGNSTVTSFGTEQAGITYQLQFSGAPLISHSTAIQCPASTALQIAANDIIKVVSQGSGNWKVSSAETSVKQAATKVVTPLVGSGTAVNLVFQTSGAPKWNMSSDANGSLFPTVDTGAQVGLAGNRIAAFVGLAVDSGTSGGNIAFANNSSAIAHVGAQGIVSLGAASVIAAGVGVAFPATQVPATDVNTLDDYEEGTWVPSIGGTATYISQSGKYTKIGNQVTVECTLIINVLGTGNTNAIAGLPFTCSSVASSLTVSNFGALALSVVYLSGEVLASSTNVQLNGTTAAASTITGGIAVLGNGSTIKMSGTYLI